MYTRMHEHTHTILIQLYNVYNVFVGTFPQSGLKLISLLPQPTQLWDRMGQPNWHGYILGYI